MSFTKVAPAGIGTEPGSEIKVGDSLLHSTGIDLGSGTGIGATITRQGNATFSGIVTASSFDGSLAASNLTGALPAIDGSSLTGVSGFSTALGNDTASLLNHIFKTSVQHNIGAGISVKIESDAGSGNIAFTRLDRINVGTGSTLHIGAGTTFLMNVLNIF